MEKMKDIPSTDIAGTTNKNIIGTSLPQKIDRPLCASSSSSNEQYQFDQSYNSNSQHHNDNLDSYDLEDDILCDNMDDNNMDDNSHHSYVFLQQQQHYTPPPLPPPPIEFQEGSQQNMTQQPQQQQQHQTLIKKGSIMRNNPELMKRNRQNNSSYELSQDLLDKQIELLERKYGGIKARKAAVTIQRAFRHYKMVKKFASITAMAKADKRISNRCSMQSLISVGGDHEQTEAGNQSGNQKVCAIISATPPGQTRTATTNRAVSFRERRNVMETNYNNNSSATPPVKRQSPLHNNYQQQQQPSSQNSQQPPIQQQQQQHSHAYVNLLHQQDQQYYNNYQNYHSHNNNTNNNNNNFSNVSNNSSLNSSVHQYEVSQLNLSAGSNAGGMSGNNSMNSSWNNSYNNSNASAYSQQQIYVRSSSACRKVPPEVPKRTSSITNTPPKYHHSYMQSIPKHHQQQQQQQHPGQVHKGMYKNENGAHSSPSSADSLSLSSNSPIPNHWKHNDQIMTSMEQQQLLHQQYLIEQKQLQQQLLIKQQNEMQLQAKLSETIRKRQYRIGLNLFNKKPEKGITYLMHKNFLENSPHAVAKFLTSRKGLSRQMIGEYLGNLQQPFNMAVLEYFADEMDFSGLAVDLALKKFQGYFRMPGEAQKIERLMEVFSHRYCICNPDVVGKLRSSDTIFVLAFAIIMLNTDLHTPNIKADRRMKCDDFIKNLRGIDDCMDIDKNILMGIYERVKETEFKTASDHVTQVMKVQKTIVGKKLNLALAHRRLVCYCRLYEIPDINKKERPGLHQREVFLFNDLLVVTKIFTKKKASVTYTFRNSFPLCGLVVTLLDVPNYPYCIRLTQKVDGKVLATFNARNEHDRCKFADDLRESINEMDEMEQIRIEMELERQLKATRCVGNGINNNMENRDSGVGDIETMQFSSAKSYEAKSASNSDIQSGQLKRGGALSNSMLDIHEQFGSENRRRGSVGSLDSGMSISFQSTSTNNNLKPNESTVYVTSAQVAMAVATTTVLRGPALQTVAGQVIMQTVPPLLPNSALYQYNNEQNMVQMHEIYEEHHIASKVHTECATAATNGRSTDV